MKAFCLFGKIHNIVALIAIVAALAPAGPARCELRLPAVFSDSMVVQRESNVPVWGWANADARVTATLAGQTASATADSDGKWRVAFKPLSDPGPYKLVVESSPGGRVQIDDVLAGEVWLCSGQSNMAMTVNRCNNAEQEMASGDYPQIRMFTTARKPSDKPQSDCGGQWQKCSPQTVGGFSATAYFFGRALHRKLNVPVGLINSSVGGTAVEAWTSMEAQRGVAEIAPVLKAWDGRAAAYDAEDAERKHQAALAAWQARAKKAREADRRPPRRPPAPVHPRQDRNHPANLYNGMIAPLVGYGIRGAIWYQGERNAKPGIASYYQAQLSTLIGDWRSRWGQGDFPFYFVQLPNFHAPQKAPVEDSPWVQMREEMLQALDVSNTGMAVTVDIGEAGDIHPKNKQDVGRRLALWALAATYEQDIDHSGPLFKSARRDAERMVIEFDHAAGLASKGGGALEGFAVSAEGKEFVRASAKIVGGTVEVFSPQVKQPAAVRYAWADNPRGNLTNRSGLPASPFRTDR